LTREQVAELLGIDPESVRTVMAREGFKERRGYLEAEVMELYHRRMKGGHGAGC
jgi:CO/xanthine dehydrogenase Mo-binding subunit